MELKTKMQMQTAGSFAIPYHIRGAKLFLVISWQPQSPSVIARRLFSMDSQRTLQTNAIRMDHTCHGKMYLPREAKGGFLDLQTCNCFLNGREQLNKWCCRLLNNTETFVDSDSGNIENKWCSLCGERSGWMTCGKCEGEGGFSTRPGLGGVKGKVRWALCKTCFGRKTIPCLLCGSQDLKTWQQSLKGANKD